MFLSLKLRFVFCVLFCITGVISNAQPKNSIGPIPEPRVYSTLTIAQPENDSIEAFIENSQAFAIAYPIIIDTNYCSIATKISHSEISIYRAYITIPGAESLNIIFSHVSLPPKAEIYVYSPDSAFSHGPFTQKNIPTNGLFATPLIEHDTIVISVHVQKKYEHELSIYLHQISYGFINLEHLKQGSLKNSGSCNININCPEGADWQTQKRSVCRLLINGTTLCTGVLLNNTENDGTPYVLTANHCISTENQANTTVFYFDYEYSGCSKSGEITNTKTLSGATLRATAPNNRVDFALLEIHETPPENYRPYYAGWDISENIHVTSASIHHPRGDAKKISIDTSSPSSASFYTYASQTHWRIHRWDLGTTEAGSSGGPIFNDEKNVFGTLSGGQATCSNPVNDYFSKISEAFLRYQDSAHQIKYWLDPLNSNTTKLPGYDPLYTLTNINPGDSISLWNFGTEVSGTFGGSNPIWRSAAEKFTHTHNNHILSITYSIALLPCANLSNLTLQIWEGEQFPDTLIFSTPANMQSIIDSSYIFVVPESPIATSKNYWIGYEFTEIDSCISFLLSSHNTLPYKSLFLKNNNEWFAANKIAAHMSLGIELKVSTQPDTVSQAEVFFYPSFNNRRTQNDLSFYSKELFAVDSIAGIYDTTQMLHLSTQKNMEDWGLATNIGADCITNKYEIKRPDFIRSIKLGVRDIPSTNTRTHYAVWDSEQNLLQQESISNSKLSAEMFNQIHFSKPVYVHDIFYVGICYDTIAENSENQNISLYSYYKNNILTSSYFIMDNSWYNYASYRINYNFAIQPITCFSEYHYNPHYNKVLQYPIPHIGTKSFENAHRFIIYPSICKDDCNIRWDHAYYEQVHIEIFNSQGIQVLQQTTDFRNGTYTIYVSELPSGFYIIRVLADSFISEDKLIISR